MRISLLIAALVALFGLAFAVWDYAASASASSIETQGSLLVNKGAQVLADTDSAAAETLYRRARALAQRTKSAPHIRFLLGRSAAVLSMYRASASDKISLLCTALANYRAAAQLSPAVPGYQIAWAELDARLRSPEELCQAAGAPLPIAQPGMSPLERLRWAEKLGPFNTSELYLAGLVYLSLEQKSEALALFRRVQEINPRFTRAQREYVYSLVGSEHELRSAMPARYPEVLQWIYHFSRFREGEFAAWRSAFVEAVALALSELEQRRSAQNLDAPSYHHFLKTLSKTDLLAASDELRQRFDRRLAEAYAAEGNMSWAAVLRRRSELQRIRVLKGKVRDDRRPVEVMVYNWAGDIDTRHTALDMQGVSLGVFFPSTAKPELLILEGADSAAKFETASIQFLQSKDNLAFSPYDLAAKISLVAADGKEIMLVELDGDVPPYLKIHYRGAKRRPSIANRSVDLIQVYGAP